MEGSVERGANSMRKGSSNYNMLQIVYKAEGSRLKKLFVSEFQFSNLFLLYFC